jgi:nitroreductase
MLLDTEISKNYWCDPGISAQSILLGATEKGLGGCIFASVKKDELRSALKINERYEVLYVLAIGKPKEKVVLEIVGTDGDIKYWRDSLGIHHVPKRPLEEIILK